MQCDHSLESHSTVLSCGAVCFVIQRGFNPLACGTNQPSVIILDRVIKEHLYVVLFGFDIFWDYFFSPLHSRE